FSRGDTLPDVCGGPTDLSLRVAVRRGRSIEGTCERRLYHAAAAGHECRPPQAVSRCRANEKCLRRHAPARAHWHQVAGRAATNHENTRLARCPATRVHAPVWRGDGGSLRVPSLPGPGERSD